MNIIGTIFKSFGSAFVNKYGSEDAKRQQEEGGTWKLIFAVYALLCMGVFELRDYLGEKVDVLSGKSAIEIFLRNNRIGMAIIGVALAVYVYALVKMRGIHKRDSMVKVICVISTAFLLVYSFVALILSSNNIYDDYKSPTVYSDNEYVLCTSLSGTESLYYVGFAQKGERILLQIPEDTYNALSEGEEDSETASSGIYMLIANSGYNDIVLYKSDVEISYYFNSAILESAELV